MSVSLEVAGGQGCQALVLIRDGKLIASTPIDVLFTIGWSDSATAWDATSWRYLSPDDVAVTTSEHSLQVEITSFGGMAISLNASAYLNGAEVEWRTEVSHETSGTLVAVRGPELMGIDEIEDGRLFAPNRPGVVVDDVWRKLAHEVNELAYPVPASMQFIAYSGKDLGIAMHVLDASAEHKLLRVGGPGRLLGFEHFPFASLGQKWQLPTTIWQTLDGGWHQAADRYRSWFDAHHPAPVIAEQIRSFPVVALEVVKSRPEDDEDIPDVLKDMESGSYLDSLDRVRTMRGEGFDAVELVGWFGEGHDTTFPDYDPGPSMGTPAELRTLIDGAHEQGLQVALYLNLRVANIDNPTYGANPHWRILTRDGMPHVEHYGDQTFHALCPCSDGWQKHMNAVVETCFRDWDADGVQLDQVGAAESMLCFDPGHGHRTPATAWGEGYLPWLRHLRDSSRLAKPTAWIWIEGCWDAAGSWVDLSQGSFWEDIPGSVTFPSIYRYAMPRHPLFGDARFAGVPYWCKTDLRRARRTYDAAGAEFLRSLYLDTQGVSTDPGAEARLFVSHDTALLTAVNIDADDRDLVVRVDSRWLPHSEHPDKAVALAGDEIVRLWRDGSDVVVQVKVPAGEVEVVRLSW